MNHRIRACWVALPLLVSTAVARADDWTTVAIPGGWKDDPSKRFNSYNGFAWYRCSVRLPNDWLGQEADVAFHQLSNSVEVFFGGKRIGAAGVMPPDYRAAYGTNVRYKVTLPAVKSSNVVVLAVRMYDESGRGGFKAVPPALIRGNDAILLEGPWQFRTGDDAAWATPDATASGTVFHSVVPASEFTKRTNNAPGAVSPADAVKRFTLPDDLQIEAVLTEPAIGQPLSISFDERGRLWLVQYLQYPDPAGLTVVSRDKFWRVVYDKVPPPPPNHFKGRDKISIHEDTDGDGIYDKHKSFVEGLNICTSAARGRGGVWVMNPPYLLFYPDRNNDDVPDGDPEVHLAGFGLEDTHSVASNLMWGPDGWLYGAQGSTVSGQIERPGRDKTPVHSMGQLIWRYHPETRRYEIYAEGGGNAFGVEIDSKGRVYSGHNGGDTRGFHYVQGGYYQKGFGKHGALSNPYAFGYFAQMNHPNVPRFTHTFLIYEGGALPAPYRGRLFGVAPLLSHVVFSEIEPDGSTFRTRDLGHAVATNDAYFRPVDVKAGPDGSLYVADFYEERIAHLNHHDGQIDPSTGRVYRVRGRGTSPSPVGDLTRRSTDELIELLKEDNKWVRQTALRLIADRREHRVVPALRQAMANSNGQFALESLWALNLCGGFDDVMATESLGHADPFVRLWTVRLLGDTRNVSAPVAAKLAELAAKEVNVEVRSQLACSARRLPAAAALPILHRLLSHTEDTGDPHLPLLIWWALESKTESDRAAVSALLQDRDFWATPMFQTHIEERLMRRFATSGSQRDFEVCAQLLRLAPNAEHVKRLVAGFEKAYAGRPLLGLPEELALALARHAGKSVVLGLRQRRPDAVTQALAVIADPKGDKGDQLQYIQILGEVTEPSCVDPLIAVVRSSNDDALRGAALASLQRYDSSAIALAVIDTFGKLNDDLRAAALALLTSRRTWTVQLIEAVGAGKLDPQRVPAEFVRRIQQYRDARIAAGVSEHWGNIRPASSAELDREVQRLAETIRGGAGSPWAGKTLFANQCGKCHTLFDEGGKIGPDLTSYQRDELETTLRHVVNPSVEIREGYENYMIATRDGRTLSGFLVDQTNQMVRLRSSEGQDVVVSRDEIDDMQVTKVSLMPEGQLKSHTAQQLRDLFAYLRSSQPLN